MTLPQINEWPFGVFIALCVVAFIQLLYNLFFFIRIAFYRKKDKTISQTHPVSVIICARDEAPNLERFLPAVLTQDYPTTHEVLVVNDNSFDDTKFFLEELEKIFRHLRSVHLTQEAIHIPGKKFPLSVGIKSSSHELLLLTDADCRPAGKNWVYKMQAGYSDQTEVVLGYGAYEKKKGLLNKLIRFETFHTAMQYLSYAMAGIPYMGVGRNLSYRKKLFYDNKGFASINHIPGGDDDLFISKVAGRKNTAVVIDPEAFTFSQPAKNFSEWWRQKNRHYSTARYYKPVHKFLLGTYAISYILFFPLLIVSAIFYNWMWSLPILGFRWLVHGLIWGKSMERLAEKDLIPFIPVLDIWQFFYYLMFSMSPFVKPKNYWN